MEKTFRKKDGVTLVEVLIVLVIAAFLAAGVYRTFLGQQKTYVVQEQVVDTQQNARLSTERMMREIRSAGFGNVSMVLPVTLGSGTYNNVVNPNTPSAGSLTILSAIQGAGSLTVEGTAGQNQIKVSMLTDALGNTLFDTGDRKYVSIGGVEGHRISSIDGGTKTLTLAEPLILTHPVGTPLFGIRATSYQVEEVAGIPLITINENLGSGSQPLTDNIEALQFRYTLADGSQTDSPANPGDIRMVRVSVTARTSVSDPDLKGGDGYRRRQFASNVHLKNMGIAGIAP